MPPRRSRRSPSSATTVVTTAVVSSRNRSRTFDPAQLILAHPEPEELFANCTAPTMMMLSRTSTTVRALLQSAWPAVAARLFPATVAEFERVVGDLRLEAERLRSVGTDPRVQTELANVEACAAEISGAGRRIQPPCGLLWVAASRCADERDEESIVYLLMSLAVMERDWPGALTFSSDLQWRDCSKRLERLRRQEVAQGLRVPADAFVAFALGMRLRGASPLAALLNHDDSCLHRWELNVGWRRQMPLRTASELSRLDCFSVESRALMPKLVQVFRFDVSRPSHRLVKSITLCIDGAPAAARELHILLDSCDLGNGCYGAMHDRLRLRHDRETQTMDLGWLIHSIHHVVDGCGDTWAAACGNVDIFNEITKWMNSPRHETVALTEL